jgi:predicted RNase H-like nuclease
VLVVGVDGWRQAWVAVVLSDGAIREVAAFRSLSEAAGTYGEAVTLAIDVPIGLPGSGRRAADVAAKRFLGRRASSVFHAPPRAALELDTYREANALCRERFGHGISAQAYRLGDKIREAEALASVDSRVVEVHREVTFAVMAGAPLVHSKKSWNGLSERRALLSDAGIVVSERLPGTVGRAAPDDVLDAAAAAWTARRVAAGEAASIPDPPETIDGRAVAIWA